MLLLQIIDEEVKRLIDEAKTKAKKIIMDHIDELHIIAKGLLEYETLTGDEINDLLKGIKPNRDDFNDDINPGPTVLLQFLKLEIHQTSDKLIKFLPNFINIK